MGQGLVLKPEMGVEGARWVDRWKGGWVDGTDQEYRVHA